MLIIIGQKNKNEMCPYSNRPFHFLLICSSTISVKLLEYDNRFAEVAGKDFIYYDYKSPLSFGQIAAGDMEEPLRDMFNVIIADPPFLSEECLTKTSVTVKYLAKKEANLIICTGKSKT